MRRKRVFTQNERINIEFSLRMYSRELYNEVLGGNCRLKTAQRKFVFHQRQPKNFNISSTKKCSPAPETIQIRKCENIFFVRDRKDLEIKIEKLRLKFEMKLTGTSFFM